MIITRRRRIPRDRDPEMEEEARRNILNRYALCNSETGQVKVCRAECDKVMFDSAESAEGAERELVISGSDPMKAYRCPHGSHYHLTTKGKRRHTTIRR